MIWVSLGLVPIFQNGVQTEERNYLGSYLGLMTLSNNDLLNSEEPKDLYTARLFGRRFAEITKSWKLSGHDPEKNLSVAL